MGNGAPAAKNAPVQAQPGKTKPVPKGTLVPKKNVSADAAPVAPPSGSNNGFFALKEDLVKNPDEHPVIESNDEFKDNVVKDDIINVTGPGKMEPMKM